MQTTFLVFGLTGDLMRYKGIPALFALYQEGSLPQPFRVVGFSRKAWDAPAIEKMIAASLGALASAQEVAAFSKLFHIVQGEGSDAASYPALKAAVGAPEKLCIYLCISPELYPSVIKNLGDEGFLNSRDAATILIEKPFGKDLTSAQHLQKLLLQYVKEEQIYRIDHYLAKEAVQELATINPLTIADIEVYLLEKVGVEKRGAVYDAIGALRDVGQNHMLEIAAAALGNDRSKTLAGLHILTPEEIAKQTRRAQYNGYEDIEGVSPASQTETYFSLTTTLENELGEKIPLTLEAGKRLATPKKEMVLTYKDGSKKTISFDSTKNEYHALFAEAFAGSRERFVRIGEVEALWRFIDPIEKEWHANMVPLLPYEPDTDTVRA